jgi:hypothetical protein
LPTVADDSGWNFARIIVPEIVSILVSFITLVVCTGGEGSGSNTSSTQNLPENEHVPEIVVDSR